MVIAVRLGVVYGHLPCNTLTDWSCIAEVESSKALGVLTLTVEHNYICV